MSKESAADLTPRACITKEQAESWASLGRELTAEEWVRLCDAIPSSTIPDAISEMAGSMFDEADTE